MNRFACLSAIALLAVGCAPQRDRRPHPSAAARASPCGRRQPSPQVVELRHFYLLSPRAERKARSHAQRRGSPRTVNTATARRRMPSVPSGPSSVRARCLRRASPVATPDHPAASDDLSHGCPSARAGSCSPSASRDAGVGARRFRAPSQPASAAWRERVLRGALRWTAPRSARRARDKPPSRARAG